MRAPGKAAARPALPGLRAPSATIVPVREWATPPANDLAMLPGPRMPQRIFCGMDVMSNLPPRNCCVVLLDVRGSVPTNVYVTGGQVHDVNLLSLNVLMLQDSRRRTGIRTFLNC